MIFGLRDIVEFNNTDGYKNCLSFVANKLGWIQQEPITSTESMSIESACLANYTLRKFLLLYAEHKGSYNISNLFAPTDANVVTFRVSTSDTPTHIAIVSPEDSKKMIHRDGFAQPIWEVTIKSYLLQYSFSDLIVDYWNIPKFGEPFFVDKFRAAKLEV